MRLITFYKITFVICVLFFVGNGSTVQAQKKLLKKADTAFFYHSYYDALSKYQKVFTKMKKADKSEKTRILFQIAECYRYAGMNKQAASQYGRVIKAKYYNIEPKIYLYLAQLQLTLGRFEDAFENFDTYLDFIPDDISAIAGRKAALHTQEAMQNITRYEIENIRKLNSRDGDWAPKYYTQEGDIISFTSTREGVTGKKLDPWSGQRFSDIWVSKIDTKGNWSTPERLDKNEKTSTAQNESDASFCNNGSVMYFTFCDNIKKARNRCIIRTASFDGKAWSDPTDVVIAGDTISDFVHPFISEDGSKMFFASNMKGGYGGLDIWYATGGGSAFENPVNLGSSVNTIEKESYPFLRNDTTLYFSSTGHNSLGGYDIFKSTLEEDKFTDVENLGYPINTNADDFGICFLPDINKGMFSSNRIGGRGNDDIFSFYLPDVIFSLSGIITDNDNLQFISDAEVNLVGSDGMIVRTLTNSKGFYRFDNSQIKPQTTYQLVVEKKDYLGTEATETTVGLISSTDFIRDFSLSKIPQGPVVLPEILYDLGKWDLKPKYQDSLMGLIVLLEKNPRLVIELASHTDIRPIAMGNNVLSQKRAQSVVDYLITRGIDPERLVARGYGAQVPRTLSSRITSIYKDQSFYFDSGVVLTPSFIDSLPDASIKEAAHQINRRTEFSILRDDFIPSGKGGGHSGVLIGDILQDTKVHFDLNPNGMPEFTAIVNGIGMQIILNEKGRTAQISTESAYRLVQSGKIGKQHFKEAEKAFDSEGEILPNKKLNIKEIKIGRFYISNVVLTTTDELPADIILNKSAMKKAGEYTIDTENSVLQFEN